MDIEQMTPEQLVEEAFYLFAPDGSDWEQYKKRRTDLLSLIQSYAASVAQVQRERDAAYLEGRAEHMDQGEPGSPARWMARIFRDEAAAIRKRA